MNEDKAKRKQRSIDRMYVLIANGQMPWRAIAWLIVETLVFMWGGVWLLAEWMPEELSLVTIALILAVGYGVSNRYDRRLDELIGLGDKPE